MNTAIYFVKHISTLSFYYVPPPKLQLFLSIFKAALEKPPAKNSYTYPHVRQDMSDPSSLRQVKFHRRYFKGKIEHYFNKATLM